MRPLTGLVYFLRAILSVNTTAEYLRSGICRAACTNISYVIAAESVLENDFPNSNEGFPNQTFSVISAAEGNRRTVVSFTIFSTWRKKSRHGLLANLRLMFMKSHSGMQNETKEDPERVLNGHYSRFFREQSEVLTENTLLT